MVKIILYLKFEGWVQYRNYQKGLLSPVSYLMVAYLKRCELLSITISSCVKIMVFEMQVILFTVPGWGCHFCKETGEAVRFLKINSVMQFMAAILKCNGWNRRGKGLSYLAILMVCLSAMGSAY